jgi:exodeoxyribonuclease-3
LRIVTWNVNGIRACLKKGFADFLEQESPDLLCIQETKPHPEQVPPAGASPEGYSVYCASAVKRGYSGVWTYAREEASEVTIGLGEEEFDQEGRTVVTDHGAFVLVNSYYPNSQRSHARLPYKLRYDASVKDLCESLRAEGREVVLTGDFNACHTHIDLENGKANEKNAGFLPEERAWVTEMLDLGYRDVYRDQFPGEKGHYTWWTYRSNARERNIGWRLDYFLVTPGLAEKVRKVEILAKILGSDHCPVRLELDL